MGDVGNSKNSANMPINLFFHNTLNHNQRLSKNSFRLRNEIDLFPKTETYWSCGICCCQTGRKPCF